ncbi:MAG: DUF2784 domain-containing protein [Gammaproteobacteria bacterium]|nr:DUF2784 domain-containing protein [Gammaproteobacteria bacterium]
MDPAMLYLLAADAVLVLHVLFVVFVIFGMLLIFVGKVRTWSWIRNPWFRLTHLSAIAVVVIQSLFDLVCPLTSIEMVLRARAGDTVYSGSFIAHWLEGILYYQLEPWAFVAGYVVFAVIVVASWFLIRPRRF